MWWILLACAPSVSGTDRGPVGVGVVDTDAPVDTDAIDTDAPPGPCGADAILVTTGAAAFCIDVYEGALEAHVDGVWRPRSPVLTLADGEEVRAVPARGVPPQAYISGEQAARACAASGKRLCRADEWRFACQGPQGWTWPYGPAHVDGACNDDYPGEHPVVDYFGTSDGVWDMAHMNDPGIDQMPDTVAPGGAFAACVSTFGVHDLHGNLHEWVDDPDGTFLGGFFADASINGPGCTYRTTAHGFGYHDYSTGFRCCADAPAGEQ